MKIIGISGSPRKNSNTAFLISEALKEAENLGFDTELVELADYKIADCCGCEGCKKTYKCVVKDDMQKIYPKLMQADGLILGSPTYFYDVTAVAKAFLDRLYCYEVFADDDRSVWMSVNEALGGKLASVISVCEQKSDRNTGHAAKTMTLTLKSLGYRVIDTSEIVDLYKRGEAQQDKDAICIVKKNGRRLAKTILLKNRIRSNIEKR